MKQKLQKQFCKITGYRKRLKLLLKLKPEDILGIKPALLRKSQLKMIKKNKNAPKVIKIKRSAIDYLAKLTCRPKKSIERGMTSFLLKNFNLENSREYSREWFVFAQRTEERKIIKDQIREKKRRNRKENPKPKMKEKNIIIIEETRLTKTNTKSIIKKTKLEDFLNNSLFEKKSQRKRTYNPKFEKSQTSFSHKKKKLSKIIIRIKRSPSYFQKKNVNNNQLYKTNKTNPRKEEKVLDQLINKKKIIKRIKKNNFKNKVVENINKNEKENEIETGIEIENTNENTNENENENETVNKNENENEKENLNFLQKENKNKKENENDDENEIKRLGAKKMKESESESENNNIKLITEINQEIDNDINHNNQYYEEYIDLDEKKEISENENIDLDFERINSPDFEIINSKNINIGNDTEFHPKEFIKNNFGYQPNNEDQEFLFEQTSINNKQYLDGSKFNYKPESMILQPQSEYGQQIYDDSEILVDFYSQQMCEYSQQNIWY
ncbi:hypothetical protein M0813_20511 [Anaeramoeba flamelloides]|uniref:Uncharacterized protein n=1 Tax=Anaeramoeba flamelloides TaxID=1746091 RepID=A0ABQ8YKU0_9EUKA|nr:hypothetical protein M0813_20511 [Anaeramoeba flamelloides]